MDAALASFPVKFCIESGVIRSSTSEVAAELEFPEAFNVGSTTGMICN